MHVHAYDYYIVNLLLNSELNSVLQYLYNVMQILWDENLRGGNKLKMNGPPTELITVEGKEHRVRKRYQHSTASKVFSASYVVSNMQG